MRSDAKGQHVGGKPGVLLVVPNKTTGDDLCPGRRVVDTAPERKVRLHLHCGISRNVLEVILKGDRVLSEIVCKANQCTGAQQPSLRR